MTKKKMRVSVALVALELIEYTLRIGGYKHQSDWFATAPTNALVKRGFAEKIDEHGVVMATDSLYSAFGFPNEPRFCQLKSQLTDELNWGADRQIVFTVNEAGQWRIAEAAS